MPNGDKNDKDEKLEQEKEELKRLVNNLANTNPEISDDDYKELLKAIDEVFIQKKENIFLKICRISLSFVLKYIVMFLCTTLISALFMSHLVINRIDIFLVSMIVSLPLTLIYASQLFGVGSFQKKFLTKFMVANILIIMILCLVNYYQFRVFKFTADWVGIEILTGGLFMVVDYYLSLAIPFY